MVDINFGCPVFEVTEKAHSGSYLLRYPDRVGQIVGAVAKAFAPTPVTAKIRLGACRDSINACDVAQAVEDAGGAALTVHGRTAADMFRGSADWEEISRIKPYLYRIPLIGNGDIATPQDVVEAFRRYDIDGVMVGRAAPESAMVVPPGPGRFARRADSTRSGPGPAAADDDRALRSAHRAIRSTESHRVDAEVRLLLRQRAAWRPRLSRERGQGRDA